MSVQSVLALLRSLGVECWIMNHLHTHSFPCQSFLFVCLWSISSLGGRDQESHVIPLQMQNSRPWFFLYQIPFCSFHQSAILLQTSTSPQHYYIQKLYLCLLSLMPTHNKRPFHNSSILCSVGFLIFYVEQDITNILCSANRLRHLIL